MYDLIGDLHGHADELKQLLTKLEYVQQEGVFRHPERKAVFVGDFIDRGPKIREVLQIVRPMVEEGRALAVMGNHELNALAFHTEDAQHPGTYLRPRSDKNIRQHCQTICQLKPDELASALAWFRTLPLWLDLEDGPRVVHACWDDAAMRTITAELGSERKITTDAQLRQACTKGNALYSAVDVILKGKEMKLPDPHYFIDKDGHIRTHTRTRWWLSPSGQRYAQYAMDSIDCDDRLADSVIQQAAPYPSNAKPIFVGHYWLSAARPTVLADNVACLDYSVAKQGFLCAYRWQGEQKLRNENFCFAGGR